MTPLCVKQYSASNSGLGSINIDLSVTGSSVMICLILSSASPEALSVVVLCPSVEQAVVLHLFLDRTGSGVKLF